MTTTTSKGIAIVTGAAQGIGRGIAERLTADGFDLVVNDVPSNSKLLEQLVEHIKDSGRCGIAVLGDVSNESDVVRLVDTAVAELGGLDVMVSNAGVTLNKTIAETSVEDWDHVFAVNVRGTFLCYKYAAEAMVKQGRGGRIIGASSMAGKRGIPGVSCYSSTKFAVRGLTQSAAQEYGKYGITVNTYAPGAIETPLLERADAHHAERMGLERGQWMESLKHGVALGKNGTPSEIASLVSYLVSKEAHFITGQSVSVDGGGVFD
ncbi:hypothetical protein ONZ45_g8467 [Pleurotus djamor]|nr:hypothetical protein ONZ45_g8467 [Pleurotus djamor]